MALLDLAVMLLQQGTTADPGFVGIGRFFAAFLLILTVYGSALGFTYWISKDE